MNIIYTLTLRHIKENKKRTIVTILGIAASTALITTMLVGITSFLNFFGKIALHEEGNWHGSFDNLTKAQVESLYKDDRIKSVAVTRKEASISGIRVDSDEAERLRLGNALFMDKQCMKNKIVCDYDGKLPANEDEVAVEERLLINNKLKLSVGSTINLELGCRYILDSDGNKIAMGGNYHSSEKFNTVARKKCKVTAILHGNSPTKGFGVLFLLEDGNIPKENTVEICLKKCDYTAYARLQKIAKDHGLKLSSVNSEYLVSVFSFNKESQGIAGIIPAGMIALFIIIGTSVILIYNAFGMSLTERMRYLGMLASVGATRKQKRASIYYEGAILGLFGIAGGIGIGLIGAYFTIGVLGKIMLSVGMLEGGNEIGDVSLNAPLPVFFLIILLSSLTIFLSSVVPAARASKIMPIDALKQSNSIKVKAGKLKTSPVIRKIFGYEGELAYKNIKRNGSKSIVITISIVASIVMFLTITNFTSMFEKNNSMELNIPYQLYVSSSIKDSDRLKQDIMKNELVTKCYFTDFYNYSFKPDKNDPKYIPANDEILNTDYLNEGYKNIFKEKRFFVVAVEDEDFRILLRKNGIREEGYFGSELKGVLLNDYYRESGKKSVFNNGILGQILHYDKEKGNPPKVKIADFVAYDKDNYLFNLIPKNAVAIYVPETTFGQKYEENIGTSLATRTLAIETNDSTKLYDEIVKMMDEGDYHNYTYGNMEQSLSIMKAVMIILKTVMYGFTTLITLIVIANLVNTISTGVIMRRKEFAMLRSVGMTEKGFKKMIILETVLYGVRALVIGIPLSLLLSSAMIKKANASMPLEIDIVTYLAVIVAVFAVIGLSMLLSISKIKNDEIIAVLKEDIC